MWRAACIIGFAALAEGHGGLIIPPARNNHGNMDPMNYTYHPGQTYHWGGPCTGDACLWFNQGCYIGCASCSREMPPGGNQGDAPPQCEHLLEPTLPFKFRTWNIKNLSMQGDWTKYHPWRSPGRAPVSDPCGVAGGYRVARGGGGETPIGAKQGDLGSELPPLKGVSTKWVAGGIAEVGWMVGANHGGGYLYSICPREQNLTESCFQSLSLPYVGAEHTIRWLDGSRPEVRIPAVDVSENTFPEGSAWRLNPIPACNCDQGGACGLNISGHEHRSYDNEPHPNCTACTTGLQFPAPFFEGCNQQIWDQVEGPAKDTWAIVDKVRVPEKTGDFVLRWRWDTEQNPQVWTHCADISIVASRAEVVV